MAPTVRGTTGQAISGTGNLTLNTPADTVVGDLIVVTQLLTNAAGTPTHAATPSSAGTWETIGTANSSNQATLRAWYKIATAAGAQAITLPANGASYNGQTMGLIVFADVSNLTPIDAGPVLHTPAANSTSIALGEITTSQSDSAVVALYGSFQPGAANSTTNYTPPAGMTELYDRANGSGIAGSGAAWVLQGAPGASGTKTATGPNTRHAGMLIAFRNASIPVTMNDVGTGADSFSVDASATIADAGTGADSFSVDASATIADAGTGADSFSTSVDSSFADAGTGVDSFSVADLDLDGSFADTGTGVDEFGVTVLTDPISDSGSGADSFFIQRQTTLPDVATGADFFGTYSEGMFVDGGVGEDSFTIVPIAATNTLPLEQDRDYELSVMAYIPNQSGPPAFVEIDAINWTGITYKDTLNAPQELSANFLVSQLTEETRTRLNNPRELPTELWLKRSGRIVFAGRMVGWSRQDQTGTVVARGLLDYVNRMRILEDANFPGADVALIVKSLIDTYQALPSGHFGIDTSGIVALGVTKDLSLKAIEGPDLFKIITEGGVGLYDVEVDPASRALTVWPNGRGADRSSGESAIIFDDRNTTSLSLMCSAGIEDIVSDVIGTGSTSGSEQPYWSHYHDSEIASQYGRTFMYVSFSEIASQEECDTRTEAFAKARTQPLIVPGPKVRVTDDSDVSDYREGDTVRYDVEEGLAGGGSFRIRSRTVTVDQRGRESVDLEPV